MSSETLEWRRLLFIRNLCLLAPAARQMRAEIVRSFGRLCAQAFMLASEQILLTAEERMTRHTLSGPLRERSIYRGADCVKA
jgi:hypothetical protein